jgi:methylmalonyl-CoA mutase C-terminal domain/subunit
MDRPIRVLLAKPGLDGHDRGVKVIARALRDAGMEVIYTGLHQTPKQVVVAAMQEDADLVGLSILSGAHNTLVADILNLMQARGMSDVPVLVGGTIPDDDRPGLLALGVAAVLGPGTPLHEAVTLVQGLTRQDKVAP